MKLLQQPLVHFLAIGALLIAAHGIMQDDESASADNVIKVDRAALLNFMQYRAKSFDPMSFEAVLAEMDEQGRDALIQQYVEEEVLVREANKLQLDSNDYVIRQRLVQKMEFLSKGFIEMSSDLSEQQVEAFYQANMDEYAQPATFTFTHFFLRDGSDIEKTASFANLAQDLNNAQVNTAQANTRADAFLYHRNYVNKSDRLVASHFGDEFVEQLNNLPMQEGLWQGPIRSEHGTHVVQLIAKQVAHTPPLANIYEQVQQDAVYAHNQQKLADVIAQVVAEYEIVKADDLVPVSTTDES